MKFYENGKEIVIPKYVRDLLDNEYGKKAYFTYIDASEPGYSICICKKTPQTLIETHLKQVQRFLKWCSKHHAYVKVLSVPKDTHYRWQGIVVTVSDPVMRYLESENLVTDKEFFWY